MGLCVHIKGDPFAQARSLSGQCWSSGTFYLRLAECICTLSLNLEFTGNEKIVLSVKEMSIHSPAQFPITLWARKQQEKCEHTIFP